MDDYKCPGCQRNDLHKMCPAHGTPFYMSGISYSKDLEKIVAILNPDDRQVLFDTFKSVAGKREMKESNEKIELYCPHCDKFTIQICYFSGHERDGSGDHRTCTVCKWGYNGYNGKYEEPWNE